MILGVIVVVVVILGLGRIAIINAQGRDAEKKRGDALQQGVNALRQQSNEDNAFFEIVRKLLVAQGAEEKQALIDQLRGLQFTTPSTTTTTTTTLNGERQSTSVTPTTSTTSVTTAPRAPSSTTTTTSTTQPGPPPSQPCVSTPIAPLIRICPPMSNILLRSRRS